MATKTTFVDFKQHEPQSVADLSGVAGDPLIAPQRLKTQKNSVFGGFVAENGFPSTIWGVGCFRNFYFLNQQQKLPTFCKKIFFLFLSHKKLRTSTKKLPESTLLDFLASIQRIPFNHQITHGLSDQKLPFLIRLFPSKSDVFFFEKKSDDLSYSSHM